MSIKFNITKKENEDADVLLPIMSLMLILIPVLVGNMAFYHFHAVKVNAPAIAKDSAPMDEKKKAELKVMSRLRIMPEKFHLDLLDENSGEILVRKVIKRDNTGIVTLRKQLEILIKEYKKLDIVLLSSYSELKYEKLLTILDEGVKQIIDVKKNKSKLKVVMVSEGEVEDEQSI